MRRRGGSGKYSVRGLVGGLTLLNHECNARYGFRVETVEGKTRVYVKDIDAPDRDEDDGVASVKRSVGAGEEIFVEYSKEAMGEDCVCRFCVFRD